MANDYEGFFKLETDTEVTAKFTWDGKEYIQKFIAQKSTPQELFELLSKELWRTVYTKQQILVGNPLYKIDGGTDG